MVNTWVKRAAVAPFRLLPASVRRRVVQATLHASRSQSPADALRELLTLDTDLSGLIDLTAMDYEGGIHVKHRLMRYHDFFVERITSRDRVLDIGCGYGAVANSIASRSGANVTGLDMDPANIAAARRMFAGAHLAFMVGEAPHVLPDGPFDVVVLSNVLEHVERRVEFLRAIDSRVKPSRWLVRVPMFDRDWRPSLRKEVGLFPYSDPTHYTEYTRKTFDAEMNDAGLEIRYLQINWGEIWAEVAPCG